MKLHKVYTEMPVNVVGCSIHQILLPTELVITDEHQSLELAWARAYATPYYVPFGTDEIVTYKELMARSPKPFRGTSNVADDVYLLEYFEDEGDDGHTEFRLQGWVPIRGKELTRTFYTNHTGQPVEGGQMRVEKVKFNRYKTRSLYLLAGWYHIVDGCIGLFSLGSYQGLYSAFHSQAILKRAIELRKEEVKKHEEAQTQEA